MSGLNRQLIERVLGYDDDYRSTQATRQHYHKLANTTKAHPQWLLSLSNPHLIARDPGNDAELIVASIVKTTLKRMTIR